MGGKMDSGRRPGESLFQGVLKKLREGREFHSGRTCFLSGFESVFCHRKKGFLGNLPAARLLIKYNLFFFKGWFSDKNP